MKESGTGKISVTVASIAMLDEHNSLKHYGICTFDIFRYYSTLIPEPLLSIAI